MIAGVVFIEIIWGPNLPWLLEDFWNSGFYIPIYLLCGGGCGWMFITAILSIFTGIGSKFREFSTTNEVDEE